MKTTHFKITNPLRFFGFFGLFLIFMFLAVKSCSDRQKKVEFVDAQQIIELADEKNIKENSAELADFIEDVKKDIKKKNKVKKSLSHKDLERIEDKEASKRAAKKITKRALKIKKKKPLPVKRKSKSLGGATVLVKGFRGVDAFSKLQLRKEVKAINVRGKGKVMVYGSYFAGEAKAKGFVRAAKIKNELIRFGLKNSISVFILPEFKSNKAFFGRVKFSD